MHSTSHDALSMSMNIRQSVLWSSRMLKRALLSDGDQEYGDASDSVAEALRFSDMFPKF